MKIEVKVIVARLVNSWTFDDIPQSTEEQIFSSKDRAKLSLLNQGYKENEIDIDSEMDEKTGLHKWGWMLEEHTLEFNTETDRGSDNYGYSVRTTEKHQLLGCDLVKQWGNWTKGE
jgi:hypothetical protein